MKNTTTIKLIAMFSIGTWANIGFSHQNHVSPGSHWHPADAWGFVALGVVAVAAFWLHHNRK